MSYHHVKMILSLCILLHALLPGSCQDLYVTGLPPHFEWGSYNRYQVDAFCFSGNKAALARCRQPAIGLSGERPYGVAELGRYRASVVMPVSRGAIGIQAGFLSVATYRESFVAAGFGLPLGRLVDLGVQLGYARTSVPAYLSGSSVLADFGVTLHLTTQVSAGWNISVPYNPGDAAEKSTDPIKYSMGIAYDASATWSAALEAGKTPGTGIGAALGFVYRPHRLVVIKMGFTTSGPPLWFGFGYQLKWFELDLSMAMHDRLGMTPAFGLLRNFKQKS